MKRLQRYRLLSISRKNINFNWSLSAGRVFFQEVTRPLFIYRWRFSWCNLFITVRFNLWIHIPFISLNLLWDQVCRIVEGQRYTKKLNERQVKAMLRATCTRSKEREQSTAAVSSSLFVFGPILSLLLWITFSMFILIMTFGIFFPRSFQVFILFISSPQTFGILDGCRLQHGQWEFFERIWNRRGQ